MMGRWPCPGFDKVDHDAATSSVQNPWWHYEHIIERGSIVYSWPRAVPTECAQVLCTFKAAVQCLPLPRTHRQSIAFLVIGAIEMVACVRVHFRFARVEQEDFALSRALDPKGQAQLITILDG